MNENFYEMFLKQIDDVKDDTKILLHSCCAPCSSYVLTLLRDYFEVVVYYYNPNITQEEEYLKRKKEEIRLIGLLNEDGKGKYPISFIEADYDPETFINMSKGHEMDKEKGDRCTLCYKLRMERTAMRARDIGIDYFATTLTLSPLKDATRINHIGLELQDKYGITYLVSDFKKKDGYKKSIEFSKEYGLYRQDYCGCVFSKRDREIEKKNKLMASAMNP